MTSTRTVRARRMRACGVCRERCCAQSRLLPWRSRAASSTRCRCRWHGTILSRLGTPLLRSERGCYSRPTIRRGVFVAHGGYCWTQVSVVVRCRSGRERVYCMHCCRVGFREAVWCLRSTTCQRYTHALSAFLCVCRTFTSVIFVQPDVSAFVDAVGRLHDGASATVRYAR